MRTVPKGLRERYDALVGELLEMGEFRRGTIIERHRRCGKARCACADKNHPGHGPQRILTYKEEGITRTVNLPSTAAMEVARGHVQEHRHFLDWCKRWQRVQEEICDQRMQESVDPAKQEDETPLQDGALKKKRRSASKPKSRGKSSP